MSDDWEATARYHTKQMALALGRDFEELEALLTAPIEPGPEKVVDHDPIGRYDRELSCPMVGGTYRHYKGGLYTVLAIARGEGTKLHYVVYRAHADGRVWMRPLSQWFQPVRRNHGDRATVTRFAYEAQSKARTGGTG